MRPIVFVILFGFCLMSEASEERSKALGSRINLFEAWITTQLKTSLAFDPSVESINYSVETLKKTVYLMGIAQDTFELARVKNHAHQLKHVRQVISYVYLKNDPRRLKPQAPQK